jgi:hypothetical protein
MDTLYIANCSKTHYTLTYYLLENIRPRIHYIPAGKQESIKGTREELDSIIKQHEIYGWSEANKIKKGFGGQCYQFNKPISMEAILQGISQRSQEQIDAALEARKITTVAADQMFSKAAQEVGAQQLAPIEVEIMQEPNERANNNKPNFGEIISIGEEGQMPLRKRGRPKRR